jgi:cell wall-associated NlpC family hydrolase
MLNNILLQSIDNRLQFGYNVRGSDNFPLQPISAQKGRMMKRTQKLLFMILLLSAIICFAMGNASAATIADCAGKVTCNALNVRERPNIDSPVVTTLANGEIVIILDKPDSDWYHVSAYGTIGYVKASYIGEVENAKNFTATAALNSDDVRMRSKPNTSADILGTYSSGTSMDVIGINNGWYKVNYAGNTGYIRSDFLELTGGGTQAGTSGKAQSEGQKIAEFALQFEGYNYVYGGESPSEGFDCSGFVYYIYSQFGYALSRTATTQYANNGEVVSQSELQPGDLLFFGYNGKICHAGLYIGSNKFIHACDSSTGVIISSLDSSWGTKSWFGAKRIVS